MPTYPYTAVGNSTSKKDAHSNAAKDFIQFLVRKGEINPADVPALQVITVTLPSVWSVVSWQ